MKHYEPAEHPPESTQAGRHANQRNQDQEKQLPLALLHGHLWKPDDSDQKSYGRQESTCHFQASHQLRWWFISKPEFRIGGSDQPEKRSRGNAPAPLQAQSPLATKAVMNILGQHDPCRRRQADADEPCACDRRNPLSVSLSGEM